MADVEKAMRLIERALALIDKQLEGQPDPLLLFVPREQLIMFQANLEGMYRVLSRGESAWQDSMSCEMAQAVIHNWPFTVLGSAIVDAERAFKECQQEKNKR